MGKHTTRNVAIVAGIVVLGIFFLMGDGGVNLLSQGGTGGITVPDAFNPTTSASDVQTYSGVFTLSTRGSDLSDPAVAYGGDTEYDTICYKDNGSADVDDWTPITSVSTSEVESITVQVSQGSKASGGLTEIWCDIDVESNQDYYVDKPSLTKDNQRVTKVIWDDPNNDNVSGWVYNYNLIGISPPDPNTVPTDTVFYKLIDEGSIDVTDPTSSASVGQGSVKSTLKFKATMSADGDGESLNQIQIRLNSTDDTQWFENLSTFSIAGLGEIKLTEFDRSDLSSTTVYKYNLGSDYSTGNMLFVDKNDDTEIDAHVVIQSNFDASNEGLCVELQLRTVDAQGAFTTSSEDAEVAEGTNGAECTL